jgi:hypothetical protein
MVVSRRAPSYATLRAMRRATSRRSRHWRACGRHPSRRPRSCRLNLLQRFPGSISLRPPVNPHPWWFPGSLQATLRCAQCGAQLRVAPGTGVPAVAIHPGDLDPADSTSCRGFPAVSGCFLRGSSNQRRDLTERCLTAVRTLYREIAGRR